MPKMRFTGLPADPGELPGGDFYLGDVPPAGVYKCKVKWIKVKENKNNDPMINGIAVVNEPKGSSKSKFNGYAMFFNQNVTEQGAPFLAQFLTALGARYKDFAAGNVTVDSEETPNIVRIGTFKVGDNPIVIAAKRGEWQGQDRLEVMRFLSAEDADEDEDDEDLDVEEDDEDDESDESEDDEDDEEEGYTREELEEMAILEIKAILKDAGWKPSEYKGYDKDDLINAVLGEDAEGDDEPPF